MNAEEIRREIETELLTKEDFIKTLAEELYRIPFRTPSADVYPAKVKRFGRGSLSVEMSDGSKFTFEIS